MATKPIVLEEKPISGVGKTTKRTSLTQEGEVIVERVCDMGPVVLKIGSSTSQWGSMTITTRD